MLGDVARARRLLRILRLPHELERDRTVQALRRFSRDGNPRTTILSIIDWALQGCDPLVREVVELVDVQCKPSKTAAKELHLSLRQFYRYRAVALDAFAHAVEQQLQAASRRDEEDLAALGLYACGRSFLGRRSKASLHAALRYFRRALEIEPSDPRAWVGIAEVHVLSGEGMLREPAAAFGDATAALQLALAADAALPEAHATHAYLVLFRDGDVATAEATLARALDLDPACASAHLYGAWLRLMRGDAPAAAQAIAAGLARHPASPPLQATLGVACLASGRLDRAVAELTSLLDFDPLFAFARFQLAAALVAQGAFPAALLHLERLIADEPSPPNLAAAAFVYRMTGSSSRAEHAAEALAAQCAQHVPHHLAALVDVGFGRADRAERELRAGAHDETPWLHLPWLDAYLRTFCAERGCDSVAQFAEAVW